MRLVIERMRPDPTRGSLPSRAEFATRAVPVTDLRGRTKARVILLERFAQSLDKLHELLAVVFCRGLRGDFLPVLRFLSLIVNHKVVSIQPRESRAPKKRRSVARRCKIGRPSKCRNIRQLKPSPKTPRDFPSGGRERHCLAPSGGSSSRSLQVSPGRQRLPWTVVTIYTAKFG